MAEKRRFVVGDVHGCNKTLDKLLFEKLKIGFDDIIYFVGDLIDRGPDSKGVIDRIIDLKVDGYNIQSVMGNHEYMLMRSFKSEKKYKAWQKNGAKSTLRSFNISHINELDDKYVDFFLSMPLALVLDEYIIVHAGLNCEVENPLNDKDSILWTRSEEINLQKTDGKRVIAGHTPQILSTIISKLNNNHIPVDGGCVYHGQYYYPGYLCAFEMNSKTLHYVINSESLPAKS